MKAERCNKFSEKNKNPPDLTDPADFFCNQNSKSGIALFQRSTV